MILDFEQFLTKFENSNKQLICNISLNGLKGQQFRAALKYLWISASNTKYEYLVVEFTALDTRLRIMQD